MLVIICHCELEKPWVTVKMQYLLWSFTLLGEICRPEYNVRLYLCYTRYYTNSSGPLINKSNSLSLFLLLRHCNRPPIATPTPAPSATPAPAHNPNVATPAKRPVTIVLVLVTVPVVTRVTLVPHTAAGTTLSKPNFAPTVANFLALACPLIPLPVESRCNIGSIVGKIRWLQDGWPVYSANVMTCKVN